MRVCSPTNNSSRRETEQFCGGVETYYKRSLCTKYRSQGVQTSFYESTPSPSNPLGDQISSGSRRNFGHAGTNHSHAPKELDNGGASDFTRVLLERIIGKKGFRRVVSSHRSKESERPHSCTSFLYVHDKLCAKLHSKRRLCVQNRPAGCVLSLTYSSQQQKVPQVRLRKQGVPVSSATIRSKYSPSGFYSIGAHGDRLSAPSGDLGDTTSRRLVNSPSGPHSFTPTSSSANEYARPCRLCTKQKEIRAGPDSGSPVSRNPFTSGLRGSFPSRVQSLGDSCTCTPSILPPCTILYSSVPANGVTQLGLRSYPSGSFVPETPSTLFSFVRSDRPVYATASIRPSGPCQPSAALAVPTFSYLRNPSPHVSSGVHDFYGRLHAGVGRSHGGFPDFGYMDPYRPQTSHQLFGAQSGNSCPTALGSSAPGPPGYDCYRQFDSSFVYQQARRDPFPHLVAVDSRASPLVRGSEHNSPSKVYPRLSEHDSRPPISSESANSDRVVSTPRDRETYLQGLGDTRSRHVCNSVELPLSSVHVSNSGAKSPSSGCSVSRGQGRSMYMFPLFPLLNKVIQKLRSTQAAEVVLIAPWWPSQLWFSHLLRLCVEHPLVLPYRRDLLSQQDQKYVSDGKSYHLHAWRLSYVTL